MDISSDHSPDRPRHHLGAIRRQSWVVGAALLLGLVAGLVRAALAEPAQAAEASVVVGPEAEFLGRDVGADSDAYGQIAASLLESDAVARRIAAADVGIAFDEARAAVTVTRAPESPVLLVKLEARSEERAVAGLVAALDGFKALLDERLAAADGASPLRVAVFDPPHAAGPAGATRAQSAVLGSIAGLLIGLLIAYLREHARHPVRAAADVEELLRAPVIGILPSSLPAAREALLGPFHAPAALVNGLDDLRANIRLVTSGYSVIAVVCLRENSRCEDVAVGLSLALALGGEEVVYAGAAADARAAASARNGARRSERAEGSAGDVEPADALQAVRLAPYAEGRADVKGRLLHGRQDDGLSRLASAGARGRLWLLRRPRAGAPFMASLGDEAASLIEHLHAQADTAVVAAGPLLEGAQAFPLVTRADLVLVVVTAERDERSDLLLAHRRLAALGQARIACVLADLEDAGEVAIVPVRRDAESEVVA